MYGRTPGRTDLSEKNVGDGVTAHLSRIKSFNNGGDVGLDPLDSQRTTIDQHDHGVFVRGKYLLHKLELLSGKIKRGSVVAFSFLLLVETNENQSNGTCLGRGDCVGDLGGVIVVDVATNGKFHLALAEESGDDLKGRVRVDNCVCAVVVAKHVLGGISMGTDDGQRRHLQLEDRSVENKTYHRAGHNGKSDT